MTETKEMAVCEAWQKLQKLEAIVGNSLRKHGSVSDRLAKELQFAQVDYAVTKDDLHDL